MKFARPISGHQERVQSITLEGQCYKGLHRVSPVKGKGSQVRGLTKALLKSRFGLAAAFVSGRRQDDRAAVTTLNAADLQIMDSAGRAAGFLFPPAGLEAKIDRLKTRSGLGRRVLAESGRPHSNERDGGDPCRAAMKRILLHLNHRDRSVMRNRIYSHQRLGKGRPAFAI